MNDNTRPGHQRDPARGDLKRTVGGLVAGESAYYNGMSKPAYVFIGAVPSGKFSLEITKDLDVASFVEAGRSESLFRIVFFEEFPTMAAAMARLEQLRMLSKRALRKLITQANPEWKDLVPRPVHFGQMIGPLPPRGDEDTGGTEGGVTARVPRPPAKPLIGADAKPWPTE
jgi:hypothetical protein